MPPLDVITRVFAGAAVGAAAGFVLGRARLCSSERCNVRANLVYSILAGAFFGAVVAWHFTQGGAAD